MQAQIEHYIINFFKLQICKAIIGNKMETQKKFNKRAFVSVGIFISGIGLPFSGLMNHSLGFDPLTVERHFWMTVHNVLGFFFTFFAVWHVMLNWKALLNHMKKVSGILVSREAVYAISIVLFFLTIMIFHSLHVR